MPTAVGQLGEVLDERVDERVKRKSSLGLNQVSGGCKKNDGH